jgi:hypothetical protein
MPRHRALPVRAACAAMLLVAAFAWSMSSASKAADVYATFQTLNSGSFTYGFGKFDLASPTGTSGLYSYAWTTLLSPMSATLANLAMSPDTGAMSLQYEFSEYRTITATGVLSGSLGPAPTLWGMAYDGADDLYAFNSQSLGTPWLKLNPANGQELTQGTVTGAFTYNDIYSSFGGNLTARPAGGFYFANESNGAELVKFTLSGTNATTVLSGSFAGTGFDQPTDGGGLSLFASGTSLYLLWSSSLFAVDESTAALTQLGMVTGLPAGFTDFTGAASPFVAVPEPAHLTLAAGGVLVGVVCLSRRRRAGQEQPRIPMLDSRAG